MNFGTIAFGQRFEVTPIQMVTAVSTIANGGTRVTPRVVKKIIDSKTGEAREIETKREEGVISKETAENVLSMMKSVVAEGTGKNAGVARIFNRGKNRYIRRWCKHWEICYFFYWNSSGRRPRSCYLNYTL